jgi:hypothetical protein
MQRIDRVLKDAERRLQEKQEQRKKEEEAQRDAAISIYKFRNMYGLPWDPQEFGFVYSAEELERAIRLQDMRPKAQFAGRLGWNQAKYELRSRKGADVVEEK